MPRPFQLAALLALLPMAMPVSAKPLCYELDPVLSRIGFSVGHDGYARALRTFSRPQGELWFDPADWRSARVEVRIDLATLDLCDDAFNTRIAARS